VGAADRTGVGPVLAHVRVPGGDRPSGVTLVAGEVAAGDALDQRLEPAVRAGVGGGVRCRPVAPGNVSGRGREQHTQTDGYDP
jgi:hypothetical protein